MSKKFKSSRVIIRHYIIYNKNISYDLDREGEKVIQEILGLYFPCILQRHQDSLYAKHVGILFFANIEDCVDFLNNFEDTPKQDITFSKNMDIDYKYPQ